jgi:hypothetical protein
MTHPLCHLQKIRPKSDGYQRPSDQSPYRVNEGSSGSDSLPRLDCLDVDIYSRIDGPLLSSLPLSSCAPSHRHASQHVKTTYQNLINPHPQPVSLPIVQPSSNPEPNAPKVPFGFPAFPSSSGTPRLPEDPNHPYWKQQAKNANPPPQQ